ELGYTGRDIYPQTSSTAPPSLVSVPSSGTQIAPQGPVAKSGVALVVDTGSTYCSDPSSNAVIRLARVRDNPSFWSSSHHCNGWSTTTSNQHGSDFWPNALFDSREGELVDLAGCSSSCANPTLAGTFYYVELDMGNLAKCLTGTA